MRINLENLPVRRNLALHLVLNLGLHEGELVPCGGVVQVAADAGEVAEGFFDFAVLNQLARAVGHESAEAAEEDNAPGDLKGEWKSPLHVPVVSVAAGIPDPVAEIDQ